MEEEITARQETNVVRVKRDPGTGRFAKADGNDTVDVQIDEQRIELTEDVALKFLKEKGYDLNKDLRPTDRTVEIIPRLIRGKEYKIGLISDTHLGSFKWQRTCTESAYTYFEEQGITDVLHTGDIADGEKMFKGHEYEIYIHGADGQAQFVIDKYPHRDGITTHFILGNHDASFLKNSGTNIGRRINDARPDMKYEGILSADMVFGSMTISMLHPKGGTSYARSYRIQKTIEQLPPEKKPNVFLMGHFHSGVILPQYRNVLGWQLGCNQAQTSFERALGLFPECGWGMLTFKCDEEGAICFTPQWIPYYKIKEEDYK